MAHARGWGLAAIWLTLACGVFLCLGSKPIAPSDVITALSAFDDRSFDHIIVREMRLPRMYAALAVGAALSVARALMQGVTRNPLADPGLLALMSGASFGVVVGAGWLGVTSAVWVPALAALGALMAALMVLGIVALLPGGGSPSLLLLSGAAVSAVLGAAVSGLNLLNEESFASFRIWLSGAITNSAAQKLPWTLPWLAVGLAIALASARQVTALSMGAEAATGLGVNVRRLSLQLLLSVVVLTASAVALVGPLGFVGLVVPHATRLIVGSDYRRIIPFSALFGASFMLLVDVAARMVIAPAELATGIVTSLIGAPLFLVLVRRFL
jgi:iron complex transport system permease protein